MGPTQQLKKEHNEIKLMLEILGAICRKLESKEKVNQEHLLTQHIDKEDNILYSIAEMHIGKEKQEKLLEEFEKLEQERIGRGKHKEFENLLHQIEKVYR